MNEKENCITCGNPLSQRGQTHAHNADHTNTFGLCGDPCHDLADEAPTLKARVEELEAGAIVQSKLNLQDCERADTANAELAEALAALEEAAGWIEEAAMDACGPNAFDKAAAHARAFLAKHTKGGE